MCDVFCGKLQCKLIWSCNNNHAFSINLQWNWSMIYHYTFSWMFVNMFKSFLWKWTWICTNSLNTFFTQICAIIRKSLTCIFSWVCVSSFMEFPMEIKLDMQQQCPCIFTKSAIKLKFASTYMFHVFLLTFLQIFNKNWCDKICNKIKRSFLPWFLNRIENGLNHTFCHDFA
jgi:hypothetical protein